MARIVDIYEPDEIANPLIKQGWRRIETPVDKLYEYYISQLYSQVIHIKQEQDKKIDNR